MLRKALVIVALALALVLPASAQESKSYSADRFDVDVTVQTGGSLQVIEQVDFRFVGGPFSYVYRELPTDLTDGITNIQAGADGAIWPLGTGPGQVEIEPGNPIRVTWHLPPTSNAVHTFDLTYDALGVVRQGDGADVLDWQALPEEYDYRIAASQVTLRYPLGAEPIGAPVLLAGKGDVAAGDNQVRIVAGDIGPDEPLIVRLNFAPGSVISAPPAWQAQQQAINDRAWLWIALGAITLVGGTAAVLLVSRRFRRPARPAGGIAYAPPSDLSPAIAGVITGDSTSVSWQSALATLFDLANRGYVEIGELGSRKWYEGQDFRIALLSRPSNLSADEQALLDLLFTDKAGGSLDSITGKEMGKLVTSGRWEHYRSALKNELILAGLLSPKRQAAAKRFVVGGTLLMVLAAVIFIAALLLATQFGYWPLLVSGALFMVAVVAYLAAATLSARSDLGEQVAASWAPFRHYLVQASKGKERIPNPELFEQYLPYAMAFGVAEKWAKQNEKAGWHDVPGYFRSLSPNGDASIAAFIAIIAATNSSGGAASATAATGAAAAGAAGGGASGAG